MKNRIQNNVYIHSMINKFLYCLVAFCGNIFLTRCLGTALNGEYTYILNTANLISIVIGLGIYQSIPFFNRKNDNADQTLLDYVNIFFFQLIFYFIIVALLWNYLPSRTTKYIVLLAVLDNITQQLNMLMLIKDVYKRNNIFLIGAFLSLLLYGGSYFLNIRQLEIALILTLIIKIYYLIVYLLAIHKPLRPHYLSIFKIKKYIAFGYLPMFTFLLITMNYKVDVLMLKYSTNVSSTDLSYYSLGVLIAETVWIISDVFKDVIFARTSSANHYEEVSAAIRISNILMLVVILGMILLGRPFIWIFYGKEFIKSYGIVVLLMCGIPLMSWFKILHPLFNALGKRWFSFFALLAAVVANVSANSILIPKLGIYGAGCASIISYFICGISFIYEYSKESGEKVYSLILPGKKDFYKIFMSREQE